MNSEQIFLNRAKNNDHRGKELIHWLSLKITSIHQKTQKVKMWLTWYEKIHSSQVPNKSCLQINKNKKDTEVNEQ